MSEWVAEPDRIEWIKNFFVLRTALLEKKKKKKKGKIALIDSTIGILLNSIIIILSAICFVVL